MGTQDKKSDSRNVLIPVILCGGAGSRLWPRLSSSAAKSYSCNKKKQN